MIKQKAYELAVQFLDTGECSPAKFIDWLYDNGYVIMESKFLSNAYEITWKKRTKRD